MIDNMKKLISDRIRESIEVKEACLQSEISNMEKAAKAVISSLKKGGSLIVFGNGGSASDSQHIVAELVGRFKKDRRPLNAVCLNTNTSTLTAVANDYGYELVFSRQVEAIGKKGDVALGISTSGNSRNVIKAIKKARSLSMVTIGLSGCGGGNLKRECDISIIVPSSDTPRIQESHTMICHILCELIEDRLSR